MRPSGPTVSECSSLATGMPASVVVGLRLSFVMIAPPLCLRVNRRELFKFSYFLKSHPGVGRSEVLLRIIAQFGGDMMEHVAAGLVDARWLWAAHSSGAVDRGASSIPSSASKFIAL